MRSLQVIVGGQFGSESKGRVTFDRLRQAIRWNGLIDAEPPQIWSVRVGGPNAGHVVYDSKGHRFALRQLPVGAVDPRFQLAIAAGSEIDFSVLEQEIDLLESFGHEVHHRLLIHPEATWLEPHHIEAERDSDIVARLGSTAKGIGAARAERIWRTARRVADAPAKWQELGFVEPYERHVRRFKDHVVIEGTQGYGLGTHAGHYPQCTSGDARAIDFAAQAMVNPWDAQRFQIHMVIRPYPIRVAGNSGELYGETSWDKLGLEEERTTVTQKVRRVGVFEPTIVQEALVANGYRITSLHLAMADQVAEGLFEATKVHQIAGLPQEQIDGLRQWVEAVPMNHRIASLGTSPTTHIPIETVTEQDAFRAVLGHEINQWRP